MAKVLAALEAVKTKAAKAVSWVATAVTAVSTAFLALAKLVHVLVGTWAAFLSVSAFVKAAAAF